MPSLSFPSQRIPHPPACMPAHSALSLVLQTPVLSPMLQQVSLLPTSSVFLFLNDHAINLKKCSRISHLKKKKPFESIFPPAHHTSSLLFISAKQI